MAGPVTEAIQGGGPPDHAAGLDVLHRIGVDQVMWECDYPHSDSNWPNSRKMLMRSLANLSDGDARKITEDNARRVFNFTGGR